MKIMASLCAWMAVGASAVVWGGEFPLEYKTLTAEKAMQFPGGYGNYGQLQSPNRSNITKEPKAKSKFPLYGQLRDGASAAGIAFRLDESKGDGAGYDELILDINRNGDLNDDTAIKLSDDKNYPSAGGQRHFLSDVVKAPADKKAGLWEPAYCAEVYIFNPNFRTASDDNTFIGQIRLKTASYLEGMIEVNGEKYRVGLVDGNANLKLGDFSKSVSYRAQDGESFYFLDGDCLLVDANKSGTFDQDQFESETFPLAPMIHFGGEPYQVSFASDFKTIKVESFAGALGVLEIKPADNAVQRLSLARESSPGHWEQVKVPVKSGSVKVPPGKYDVASCVVEGGGKPGERITAMASKRMFKTPVIVEEGKTAAIQCGAPLEIKVTAEKQGAQAARMGGLMGAAVSLFTGNSGGQMLVNINMAVVGAGGESYSNYSNGRDPQLPKPAFSVMDEAGVKVASGSLEYG